MKTVVSSRAADLFRERPRRIRSLSAGRVAVWLLVLGVAVAGEIRAAVLTWTNSAGGVWSNPVNWNPNQVPGPADTASLTAIGSYTVTLDESAAVQGLIVGATSGSQVLTNLSSELTLGGPGFVQSNGVLGLAGGDLDGAGVLSVEGVLAWSGGGIAVEVAIQTNGSLLVGGIGNLSLTGVVTNAGLVMLGDQSGLMLDGAEGGGQFYNLAGATLASQGSASVLGVGQPGELLSNEGIIHETGGILTLAAAGQGGGEFVADGSSIIDFTGAFDLTDGASLSGDGTNMNSGSLSIQGNVSSSNVVLSSGVFQTTNGVLQGSWVWSGGEFLGMVEVSSNSSLNINLGGVTLELQAVLINHGSILLAGDGVLRLDGFPEGGGDLVNFAGGRIVSTGNVALKSLGYGSEYFGNDGVLEVQNGTLTLGAGGVGGGQFIADVGSALVYPADFTANDGATFAGAGTNSLAAGVFTLNGKVTLSNAVLNGASLRGGVGQVAGTLTWISGDVAGDLTVLSNGLLTAVLPSGGVLNYYGILTNAGTVSLEGSGAFICNGNYLGEGDIYNQPGGKIVTQGNVALSGAGVGTELVANSGVIEASNGTLAINLGGVGSGQFVADAGAVVTLSGDFVLNNGGGLTGAGMTVLGGGVLGLNGRITGSNTVLSGMTVYATNAVLTGGWTWASGSVFGNLTIAGNAVLNVAPANANDLALLAANLANAGTVTFQGQGTFELSGIAGGGMFVNLSGGIASTTGSTIITNAGFTNEVFINQGVFSNQSGAAAQHFAANFVNLGVVDSESGVLSFDLGYAQTNGVMRLGINGPQSAGTINFAAAASLEGTLEFNLNNGYSPNPGTDFVLITYSSFTGGFADTNTAFLFDWATAVGNQQTDVMALQKVSGAEPPAILSQPVATNVVVGQPVGFSVSVAGTEPIIYQWRLNGVNIPGARSPSLSYTGAHPALAGVYSVVVRNVAGTVTSDEATLEVLGVRTLALDPPLIAPGTASFSIPSQISAIYVLERKTALTEPAWTKLQMVSGTGGPIVLTDSSAPSTSFYRIQIQ